MATCFSLSLFRNLRKTSPSRSVSGETLCVKAIFDMIRHFSALFNAAIDAHPDFVISVSESCVEVSMKAATTSAITEAYIRKTPSSQARYARAREIFPSEPAI